MQDNSDTGDLLAVLFWHGRDALAGHLVGLQFSLPDSSGALCFDLSIVHDDAGRRFQGSLHREHFQIAKRDLGARLAHCCAFAMGIAFATEKSPFDRMVWQQRVLRPERLC